MSSSGNFIGKAHRECTTGYETAMTYLTPAENSGLPCLGGMSLPENGHHGPGRIVNGPLYSASTGH
jgi:hypothetical protein